MVSIDLERKMKMEQIRYLKEEEKWKTRLLYEQAFSDSREFVDYYYSSRIKDNKVLVLEIDKKIVSMAHGSIRRVLYDGEEKKILYLYAVATDIKYRKHGYMKKVVMKMLEDAKNEGFAFATLITENEVYYNGFGFQSCGPILEAVVDTRKKDSLIRRKAFRKDFLSMTEKAALWLKDKSLYQIRTISYYETYQDQLESENGYLELVFSENECVAIEAFCINEKKERIQDGGVYRKDMKNLDQRVYGKNILMVCMLNQKEFLISNDSIYLNELV